MGMETPQLINPEERDEKRLGAQLEAEINEQPEMIEMPPLGATKETVDNSDTIEMPSLRDAEKAAKREAKEKVKKGEKFEPMTADQAAVLAKRYGLDPNATPDDINAHINKLVKEEERNEAPSGTGAWFNRADRYMNQDTRNTQKETPSADAGINVSNTEAEDVFKAGESLAREAELKKLSRKDLLGMKDDYEKGIAEAKLELETTDSDEERAERQMQIDDDQEFLNAVNAELASDDKKPTIEEEVETNLNKELEEAVAKSKTGEGVEADLNKELEEAVATARIEDKQRAEALSMRSKEEVIEDNIEQLTNELMEAERNNNENAAFIARKKIVAERDKLAELEKAKQTPTDAAEGSARGTESETTATNARGTEAAPTAPRTPETPSGSEAPRNIPRNQESSFQERTPSAPAPRQESAPSYTPTTSSVERRASTEYPISTSSESPNVWFDRFNAELKKRMLELKLKKPEERKQHLKELLKLYNLNIKRAEAEAKKLKGNEFDYKEAMIKIKQEKSALKIFAKNARAVDGVSKWRFPWTSRKQEIPSSPPAIPTTSEAVPKAESNPQVPPNPEPTPTPTPPPATPEVTQTIPTPSPEFNIPAGTGEFFNRVNEETPEVNIPAGTGEFFNRVEQETQEANIPPGTSEFFNRVDQEAIQKTEAPK